MNQSIRYGRKPSGIKRDIYKKVEGWIESISDTSLQNSVRENVIVTGGCIASMMLGERVNDYDIYFRNIETAEAVANYYANIFIAEGIDLEVKRETVPNIKGAEEDRVRIFIKSSGMASAKPKKKVKYQPVFMSENAITLSNSIQIITRFYGEPDQIHDNYDFEHAKCYWDHGGRELNLPSESLQCMLSRTLHYSGSLYPIASIFRMKKFINRGWRISAGQQLKIMWQISEINLRDKDVLRDQLTGVDAAYLHALIEALDSVDAEKLNSDYVGAVIDRIFDQSIGESE